MQTQTHNTCTINDEILFILIILLSFLHDYSFAGSSIKILILKFIKWSWSMGNFNKILLSETTDIEFILIPN